MLVIGDGVGEPGTTSRGCHTDVPEEETRPTEGQRRKTLNATRAVLRLVLPHN